MWIFEFNFGMMIDINCGVILGLIKFGAKMGKRHKADFREWKFKLRNYFVSLNGNLLNSPTRKNVLH